MIKALTICLLFIFSVTQTELGQLLKLPFLFEHYSKHHQQNNALSFIGFLKDHYSRSHQDQDQKEDSKLPFLSSISQPPIIAIVSSTALPQRSFKSVLNKYYLLNELHHLPQIFHSIFHPPQDFIS
ncbi:hypothetical protein OCK74_22100 [Chitinophagaceae bacterium LB-8]|uniref:Uncharacterized protein n=1 Tax=Paraflavisolibacter caeni TaxID=2982496 RepID=A0A9X3BJY8_9BACT|nr:hypothetical protein [Paraflavisolibacter caeni]MCU7551828.1 hypothetical protein [Paraflavisolibacter caeni]